MVKILRNNARLAKWYGGRLENGYAQACRGSNPLPGVPYFHTIIIVNVEIIFWKISLKISNNFFQNMILLKL